MSNAVQQPAQPVETPAPVIFLDTNALHYATLALSFAAVHGIDLGTEDVANFKTTVKAQGVGAEDYFEKGAWTVRYLISRCAENAVYYYSPLTRLELLCGGLRGEAIKHAASVGVPNRWFNRIPEDEVCLHLEPNGYAFVQTHHTNVEASFQAAGVAVNELPLDADVWQLAKALMENVFIDVQDCVIYASAMCAQANELITFDGFVRKTACYACNPGGAPQGLVSRYHTVRDALTNVFSQAFGWPSNKVIVPTPVGMQHIKQSLSGSSP